jgi:hypothetical protein
MITQFYDLDLPWNPFGMEMDHLEWEILVDWYVGTFEERQKNHEEEKTYGLELYTQEFATRTD